MPSLSMLGLLAGLTGLACDSPASDTKKPAPSTAPRPPAEDDGPADEGTEPPAKPEANDEGVAAAADPPPPSPSDPATAPDPPAPTEVEATIEIDEKPGAKKFQGVWLVPESGGRLLISYRAPEYWRALEGRRVKVLGKHYEPQGQAIMADHFRVHSLEVIEPTPEDSIIAMSRAEDFEGHFEQYEWPKRAKGAGSKATVFVGGGGRRFWLHHVPEPAPPMEKPVKVHGFEYEPSNFMARPGGAYLWVLDVEVVK